MDIHGRSKRLEKKLDGNYTRLCAILPGGNTQQDTNCMPPITKTIQVRRTRHLLEKQRWTHKRCTFMDPHTRPRKSRTTSMNVSAAMTQDTGCCPEWLCLWRWTIGRSGKEGQGYPCCQHDWWWMTLKMLFYFHLLWSVVLLVYNLPILVAMSNIEFN